MLTSECSKCVNFNLKQGTHYLCNKTKLQRPFDANHTESVTDPKRRGGYGPGEREKRVGYRDAAYLEEVSKNKPVKSDRQKDARS